MWKCTNCHHVHIVTDQPARCSVCGKEADSLVPHEVPGIKGEKTLQNLKAGFVAESQATLRNLAFAMRAEEEGSRQMGKLVRAVSEAEGVNAFAYLRLLHSVAGTQENLETSFEKENLASNVYPEFIKEANREGNAAAARVFGYSRDVERGHAKLYEKALQHMLADADTEYYVCGVCGYVSDGVLPEEYPICGAPRQRFRKAA